MTNPEDFFALDGPPRDGYGRPKLFPADHDPACTDCAGLQPNEQKHRKPYTRASSLSDYLADFSHLWKWKQRYLARSLGQNPDLAALAGAECYTTGFDKGDEKENRASGRRLDDIIDRALDRGGISVKADYGTVVHALTEPGNDGGAPGYQGVEADVASWWRKLHELGVVIIGTELFTANDELMVSGTFDHLAYVPGSGIVIIDKKTSSKVHGEDFRIQLSTYANADLYDWETDERTTLEDYVEALGWNPEWINREVGHIFWIKDGETSPHRLDLVAGYEAAGVATWVRDNRRKGKHSWPADGEILEAKAAISEQVETAIREAKTEPELRAAYAAWRQVWTDAHTELAKTRKAELS